MGKKDEIRKQIEALQKEHDEAPDDDDDDLEIDVEKDGSKVRLRGRHARKVMRRLGLDDDEKTTPADGDPDADKDGDPDADKDKKDPAPPAGHRYFK